VKWTSFRFLNPRRERHIAPLAFPNTSQISLAVNHLFGLSLRNWYTSCCPIPCTTLVFRYLLEGRPMLMDPIVNVTFIRRRKKKPAHTMRNLGSCGDRGIRNEVRIKQMLIRHCKQVRPANMI